MTHHKTSFYFKTYFLLISLFLFFSCNHESKSKQEEFEVDSIKNIVVENIFLNLSFNSCYNDIFDSLSLMHENKEISYLETHHSYNELRNKNESYYRLYKNTNLFLLDTTLIVYTKLMYPDTIGNIKETDARCEIQFHQDTLYSMLVKFDTRSYRYSTDSLLIHSMFFNKYGHGFIESNFSKFLDKNTHQYYSKGKLGYQDRDVCNITRLRSEKYSIKNWTFKNASILLIDVKKDFVSHAYDYNEFRKYELESFDCYTTDRESYVIEKVENNLTKLSSHYFNYSDDYIIYYNLAIHDTLLSIEHQNAKKRAIKYEKEKRQREKKDSIENIKLKEKFKQQTI